MQRLLNKTIIVTGGSGLLGRSICEDIRNNGGKVYNLDLNSENNIADEFLECDTTSVESVQKAIDHIMIEDPYVHGLVNNAYPRTKDWGTDFEKMDPKSLTLNVEWQMNSYINMCRLILPLFRKSKVGSVVNITSIYGVVGNNFNIYEEAEMTPPMAYSAIKGGIINATRFLASKYGDENIRFNCVSPGGIFDHQPKSFVDAYEKQTPMKRMGVPDDISPSVSFLLSNDSKYITGHNLIVDGGWTAI